MIKARCNNERAIPRIGVFLGWSRFQSASLYRLRYLSGAGYSWVIISCFCHGLEKEWRNWIRFFGPSGTYDQLALFPIAELSSDSCPWCHENTTLLPRSCCSEVQWSINDPFEILKGAIILGNRPIREFAVRKCLSLQPQLLNIQIYSRTADRPAGV
jgi:hypothetical protein